LDPLVDDLMAEQEYLIGALQDVPAPIWDWGSPAEGWLLRDCVAHI
jgi:hypothetical protein